MIIYIVNRYQEDRFRTWLHTYPFAVLGRLSACLSVMGCLLFVAWREQPLVLPPSLKENILDFGVRSATHTSSITFVVVNSNPIEVRLHSLLDVLVQYTQNRS